MPRKMKNTERRDTGTYCYLTKRARWIQMMRSGRQRR